MKLLVFLVALVIAVVLGQPVAESQDWTTTGIPFTTRRYHYGKRAATTADYPDYTTTWNTIHYG